MIPRHQQGRAKGRAGDFGGRLENEAGKPS
jgi:hypothetical protein